MPVCICDCIKPCWAQRRMNYIPTVLYGGRKSFFWWKNKFQYEVLIKKNLVLDNDIDHINQNLLNTLNSKCKGLWELTVKSPSENPIRFSNKSDAVYFKLMWG